MNIKKMEIVINQYWDPYAAGGGSINLSQEAKIRYRELKGITEGGSLTFPPDHEIARDDPALIQVIKEFGEKVNDLMCKLEIIEIPDDVEWEIVGHDGYEWVAEKHRRWGKKEYFPPIKGNNNNE